MQYQPVVFVRREMPGVARYAGGVHGHPVGGSIHHNRALTAASPAVEFKVPVREDTEPVGGRPGQIHLGRLHIHRQRVYAAEPLRARRSSRPKPPQSKDSDSSQKSYCNRTLPPRGGAIAVPENSPAKLMTFSRLVRFSTTICRRSVRFSCFHRSAPALASNVKFGRTRPASKLTRSTICCPYCDTRAVRSTAPSISTGNPLP